MSDDDSMIAMTTIRHKGRSASVCYSAAGPLIKPSEQQFRIQNETVKLSPPITPPPTTGDKPHHARHHPATRTQSARLTSGKSVRRRFQFGGADADNVKPGSSDPRLNEPSGSGTSSPIAFRRRGSQRRVNSVYQSPSQRKSTTFLDIPKNSATTSSPTEPPDENSYRLRSFSYTSKGIVNRGDSFRKKHHRSNSILLSSSGSDGKKPSSNYENTSTAATVVADTDPISSAAGQADEFVSYNVFVLGAKGVGKTSLISQFMTSEAINAYDKQKDAPSQQTVSIMLNGIESELCFHELKNSKPLYQKKLEADAFIVMYSVVDKTTFQRAEAEISRLHDTDWLLTRPVILVGNKMDLARSRTVSIQDGKCVACTFRIKFAEISVGINHNVDELLVGTLNQIRLKREHASDQDGSGNNWYKGRGITRATMKARQMFTWIFGKEDAKFKNCENLNTL